MAIEREIRLGPDGEVLEQIEFERVGVNVRRRVLVPNGRGQLRVQEERPATTREAEKLEVAEHQEVHDAVKEEQRAEVAALADSDPVEVSRRVLRKEITAEEARELGWKPRGANR